jgi:hypothetical protein
MVGVFQQLLISSSSCLPYQCIDLVLWGWAADALRDLDSHFRQSGGHDVFGRVPA